MQSSSHVPSPRLPTVVTSSVANYLPLSVPVEPSNVAAAACQIGTQPVPSAALLHAVCGALLSVDTSNLHPRWPVQLVQHPAAQPGTLEHALLELNPLVFRSEPGPGTNVPHAGDQAQQQQQQQAQHRTAGRCRAARPASGASSAAAAAPAEEGQPAAKRRKTLAPTDEEFVSRTIDGQQVAAAVAEEVNNFLLGAAALSSAQEAAGHAADGVEDMPAGKRSRKAASRASQQHTTCLELLKQLQSSLAAGKQAGILSQLDHGQLRQLLLLLLNHVRLGQDKLIEEHDMGGTEVMDVTTALEAACCCVQVLAAADMHSSLYLDEVVTGVIQLAKFQLQKNVLALHDPQYMRLYRPSAAAGAAGAEGVLVGSGKRKTRESGGSRTPKALADVRSKLELLLSILAQVVERFALEVELLLPLVRVALTCLTVDSLQLLQAQAVALTVSVFRAYPQQRSSLFDEVLTSVVDNIHVSSKVPPRYFEAMGAGLEPLPVMMATALIVQLVQASVELPGMDADAASIQTVFRAAFGWSDYLWQAVFGRLPAAKAARTEGAADFKLITQALLSDLVTLQMLPEWPAANILLRRFIKHLAGDHGIKHKDAAVRLACVEFTGQLATALSLEALAADSEADEVQAIKEAAQAAADPAALEGVEDQLQLLPDMLLLDYLAASRGSRGGSSSSSTLATARCFMCCRMLHDTIHADRGAGVKDPKQLTLMLVQHRKLQDAQLPALGGAVSGLQLGRSQVVALLRQGIMRGALGGARGALIKWLLEAGSRHGPDPSPATVRTKVFKCLGAVVEADSCVMASAEVAAAVQAAQEDDSAAVKEAVLELLVKLININPQLAGEYFETLRQASYDPGIMVRKRAIRALWECCSCPGFSRAGDAVVAVLQRAYDKEDSMRTLVTKICGEMWFTDASSFAGLSDGQAASSSSAATRTPAVRAAELANLSLQLYEAGGRNIHVPLPPDHGLIVIFKEVLGTGSSSSSAAAAPSAKEQKEQLLLRQGAADMAQALLEMILQQHRQESADDSQNPDSSSGGSFKYLLALHVLTAADPGVAAPAADTQRFVRCLAPYASALASTAAPGQQGHTSSAGAGGGAAGVDDSSRRAAEEALCLLAVLESVLSHLGAVEQDVAQQLSSDLVNILNKQRYLQLIAASCQLLCTLAALYQPAAEHVKILGNRVYSIASPLLTSGPQGSTPNNPVAQAAAHAPRVLYLLGQLCRYGADVLDAAAAASPSNRNCTECLELCVSLWYKHDLPDPVQLHRLREAAMQAMGLIIIGRPHLLLQPLQLSTTDQQHSTGATVNSAHSGGSGDADSPSDQQDKQQPLVAQDSGVLGSVLKGNNVVGVYTAALDELSAVPMSVKVKVLNSLVELLRVEEATLLARQKEAEAASVAGKLPSTLPAQVEAKALAKVNGEGDAAGGSGSTSVIQCVWPNVLRLATAVPGGGGGAGGSMAAPPPVSTAAVMEAAATRRKALELVEVVLRGGLVAPWDAVPPLVAQLTDELPETRTAALKVLKSAHERYPDIVADKLAAGVLEAFNFQSKLWVAKHPGQPLPKGPSPEVLEGLSAMYCEVVQGVPSTRQKVLTSLLKPFQDGCNLALSSAAAASDPARLAFCVYVAANLPYKKADEPLVLLHVINGLISRMAQEGRDVLRQALLRVGLREQLRLEDDEEEDATLPAAAAATPAAATPSQQQAQNTAATAAAASAQQQPGGPGQQQQQQLNLPLALPLPAWLLAPLKASLGLSMLLVLKQYLMAAFALSDERVAQYELKGEKARAEAKAVVARSKKTGDFALSVVNLRCVQDGTGELLAEQYRTFAALLDNDAANYREIAALAALADQADDEDGEGAAAAHGGKHTGPVPAAASGLVVYSMDAKAKSTRTRGGKGSAAAGRASTGGGGGRGSRGRGTGRTTGSRAAGKKTKSRRRRFEVADDSSEEDAGADSGDEEWDGAKPGKARKLFE